MSVETTEKTKLLPLLPVRDVVVFPHMMLPLVVGRPKSVRALEDAMAKDKMIFLVAQKRLQTEDPTEEDLYRFGAVAEVLQHLKLPDGTSKILVEGKLRARLLAFRPQEAGFIQVEVETLTSAHEKTAELEALTREAINLFEEYVRLNRRFPFETALSLRTIDDPDRLADVIAGNLLIKLSDKQALLEAVELKSRFELLIKILNSEMEILSLERKIQGRVRHQIEKSQKEYYLTEQMKAIQKELRQKDDFAREMDDLKDKIKKAKMSKEAEAAAAKELERLSKMMPMSPEATVIRTYIDWMVSLPWSVKSEDNLDLKRAERILNEDHYGLEKAKERILEYLAVCKLTRKMKGPILCFVGPPGVGKTSLGKSIARAIGRKFVRMSLGGVRDEAEIRGHRRTYIGSLPGRILQSMRKAKSKNPVFLLDEVDKIGADFRGDPAAALLEVLDPEQNTTFNDHYLEVDFDLSDVLFITTANTLFTIPPSLQDRMEILRFSGYTQEEKIHIAQKFLIPKQMKEHGLKPATLTLTHEALEGIIHRYTQEAGVRNLEREIANICRKVARQVVSRKARKHVRVTSKSLHRLLGVQKYSDNGAEPNRVGVATGLAWTESGGDTMNIEVSLMPGKGKLTLTGKLGEVMQESAQAALSFIRANGALIGLKNDFYKNKEIHIHVPEGAVPKDGPSAGITIATALASALSRRSVKRDVAMTGEITLRGRVLPIGGFKEKTLAAHRRGIRTVLYPHDNQKDMEDIPKNIQKKMRFVPVKRMEEVLKIALDKRTVSGERLVLHNTRLTGAVSGKSSKKRNTENRKPMGR